MRLGQAILYLVAGLALLVCALPAVAVVGFLAWSGGPIVIRTVFPDFWFIKADYAVSNGRSTEDGAAVFRCRRKSLTGPYTPGWQFFHGPDNSVVGHRFADGSVVLFDLDPDRLCVHSGSVQAAPREWVMRIVAMDRPDDVSHIERCRTVHDPAGDQVDPNCWVAVRRLTISRIAAAPPSDLERVVPLLKGKAGWIAVRNMSVAVADRQAWLNEPDLAPILSVATSPSALSKLTEGLSPAPWRTPEFRRMPFREASVTLESGAIDIHSDETVGPMERYAPADTPWSALDVRLDGRLLNGIKANGFAFDPVSGLLIAFAVDQDGPVAPLFATAPHLRSSFVDLFTRPPRVSN